MRGICNIALYDLETDLVSFPYYVDDKDLDPPPARKQKRGITEFVLRTVNLCWQLPMFL